MWPIGCIFMLDAIRAKHPDCKESYAILASPRALLIALAISWFDFSVATQSLKFFLGLNFSIFPRFGDVILSRFSSFVAVCRLSSIRISRSFYSLVVVFVLMRLPGQGIPRSIPLLLLTWPSLRTFLIRFSRDSLPFSIVHDFSVASAFRILLVRSLLVSIFFCHFNHCSLFSPLYLCVFRPLVASYARWIAIGRFSWAGSRLESV
jgi:hypothetical protein